MIYNIFVFIVGIIIIYGINKLFSFKEDDFNVIDDASDLDIYIKQSIKELKSEQCNNTLSDVIDYASKLNFRNNYDKRFIKELTREEYGNSILNISNHYENLLNDKMTYDDKIKNYLLKYFIDDIAI